MKEMCDKYFVLIMFLSGSLWIPNGFFVDGYMYWLILLGVIACVTSVKKEIKHHEFKERQKGDVITLIRRSSKLVMYDDMSGVLTEEGKKLSEETKANKDRVREAIKKAENRGRL